MSSVIKISLFLFLGFCLSANGDLDFVSPVKHTLRISGNFGEYRTNHYHSGIDIKSSKGIIGDDLFSIHDGYISRIKIQSGGYGNVLFITHPNGFTSVYAHMEEFLPELMEYVKQIQYELEIFEIEAYLPEGKFTVNKGQKIGLMGTTGRSTGPHLHFELRETQTDRPVNPYLYGITPKDDIFPEAQHFAIYDLEDPQNPKRIAIHPFKKLSNGNFGFREKIKLNARRIGLGIQMYDKMNGASNKNEVYACKMTYNDSLDFWWKADKFDFEETKYVNARLDFERKLNANQKLQLLFTQNCNSLSIIKSKAWNGIIDLNSDQENKVKIQLKDVAQNAITCELDFNYSPKEEHEHTHPESQKRILCDQDTALYYDGISIFLPKSSVYNALDFEYNNSTTELEGQNYKVFQIANSEIPVHHFYKVVIQLPPNGDKWCLIKKNKRGTWRTFGGTVQDDFMTVYLDEFGDFVLYADNTPPVIQTIRYSGNLSKYGEWRFLINDNLDSDGLLDDLLYAAYIDGKWARLFYDKKNDLLRFTDMEQVKKESKSFEIVATDHVGNEFRRAYKLN